MPKCEQKTAGFHTDNLMI